MRLKANWNNWKVFFASTAAALALTPILVPNFQSIFGIYSGNEIFPVEVNTYPGTASLIYVLLISFLYTAFSKDYKRVTLFYFVLVPFLVFSVSGTDVFIAGTVLAITGFFLGKLLRDKLSKN